MATDIVLLATAPPARPGPDFPAGGASPAEHLAWCERFELYCARQARFAHDVDLPTRKWLQAAEFAAFAASIWRERLSRLCSRRAGGTQI
jgi:hypothetical protein